MTTTLNTRELIGGTCSDTVLFAGWNATTISAPTQLIQMGATAGGAAVTWYAPYPGIIDSIYAGMLVSSGSTTAYMAAYIQAGGTGAFVATGVVTPTISLSSGYQTSTFVRSGMSAYSFAKGDGLALFLVVGSSSAPTVTGQLAVRMFA